MGVIFVHQYTLKRGSENLERGLRRLPPKSSSKFMTWVHINLWMPPNFTKKRKIQALSSLMFITEKGNNRVTSRKCAIGNKQRKLDGYDKAAGSSPTVSTDGLIVTTAIDAHKGRDAATMDTQTAFLYANNDEYIIMLLEGKVVKLLIELQPELYRK